MSVYAQHGYGKGSKIERALAEHLLEGVFLSPRDETIDNLVSLVAGLRKDHPEASVLLDPQTYASIVASARDGHLGEYPFYRPGLTRRDLSRPGDLRKLAQSVLDYQRTLGTTRLLAPTICFDDFRDPWSQIAISLASEALELAPRPASPRMLLSLVIAETAFGNREGVEEFLDLITSLDAEGFYLVVKRESASYQATFKPDRLAHLLYFVYVLSQINGFEVVCGFSDLVGTLLHAVGAAHTASGWFSSTRQFTLGRFEPATGGRRPRPRYTSAPLLNSILVSELDVLAELGVLRNALSVTAEDHVFATASRPGSTPWPPEASALHHWRVLSRLATQVGRGSTSERLEGCSTMINNARGTYSALQRRGAVFGWSSNAAHLEDWTEAIRSFRALAGV